MSSQNVSTCGDRVSPWRARLFALAGLGAFVALVVWLWRPWDEGAASVSDEALYLDAKTALERGDLPAAERFADRIEKKSPFYARGRLIAGEAAMRAERYEKAIECFEAVPHDGSNSVLLAATSLGEIHRQLGHLTQAEAQYRYVLELDPNDEAAHDRMVFLLSVTGREWEARPHHMHLIRSRSWTLDSLALLGDLERPLEQRDYLNRCAKSAPDDVLVQLGLARLDHFDGKADRARASLTGVVQRRPDLLSAQALLGELLVDADNQEFERWHNVLPVKAEEHPNIWLVRGLWARKHGRLKVAARCFWETVRREPSHRRGNYQLGQVLVALNEPAGSQFAERAAKMFELTDLLDDVLDSRGQDTRAVKRVTQLMEETGRYWEAWAWANTASEIFPSILWAREVTERISPQLKNDTPQMIDSTNLAVKYDLSMFPNYSVMADLVRHTEPVSTIPAIESSIRFEEATDVGIDFVYNNAADPATPGARMFEQTGGGVAVIDFDLDHRPDLFFTQGAEWKFGSNHPTLSRKYVDRIFRNLGDSFVDVTAETGLGSQQFGQGIAVGDFDGDGFDDLYVANIGRNRLYQNNGDGTFRDVSEECGLDAEEWTASCVFVDLNADGLADLFDVNYLTGRLVYTLICQGKGCSPSNFAGVPDRVYFNQGDGFFQSIEGATPNRDSKGLGVVTANLYDRDRPSLFIANDQVANFFLRNVPADNDARMRFEDEGFVIGLGFNEDGLAMGCMGIAADDVDGNGLIDFLVTNFHNEANTLYLQDTAGLFVDATSRSGLLSASLPMVGWGTQFLDADFDGNPDLVVANGHVDDYRDQGGEFHMRPQFFRNIGRGQFNELSPDQVGPYFDQKFLGRGLARLDWNGDGLMDFVVSNIGDPASLVTNRSINVGNYLNVRLTATQTARDAIGTVVEVTTAQGRWTKQLVAGDGYQASNQRMLQFGLGMANQVDEVQILWPSGETTILKSLPTNVTIELVEGGRYGNIRRDSVIESLSVPDSASAD